MRTAELDYDLDPALIAREPVTPRDAARLLVYRRSDRSVEHRHVGDVVELFGAGDLLVVNETSVAPVRVKAARLGSGSAPGARIEGLLLERRGPREWWALLRNTKRLIEGESLLLIGPHGQGGDTEGAPRLRFLRREGEGSLVRIESEEPADLVLSAVGWTPLPPYILKARRDAGDLDDGHSDPSDRARYQTVFAAPTDAPSVAAPTAGLHFTPELLAALATRGVERIAVSLQVGAGTFKPIETASVEEHPMHSERCFVSDAALRALGRARSEGGRRIIAVGTTSVRTLESMPEPLPASGPLTWETNILIQPGYRFRSVDALLTNFHLPRSTLLALVAAMMGLEELKRVYAIALGERYRFYSYGDAMLIL